MSDDTEPSEEALELYRELYADIWAAIVGNKPWPVEKQHEAASRIDRFRAAERERCFKWAIGRRPRSFAAQAIREGWDPTGHPLDTSLCWRCGETLHPGHDCRGASP